MARSQARSKRKVSGGRYHSFSGKRKYELAGFPANTKLGEDNKVRAKRTIGGNKKVYMLTAKFVNVTDKQGKTQKVEVLNVVDNPANPNLVRRNIITKGAVVETKLGKVKITNRPGQEGSINGVLV